MAEQSRLFASIIMPALNEERYIADAIASILPAPGTVDYELLVMDGGSTDRTVEIVQSLVAQNPNIRLAHNPRKIQSAAMNIAAEICDPCVLVMIRADCHARYPHGFVNGLIHTLQKTGSSSVVTAMHAIGLSPVQKAIAAAQNSRLGNGGSIHRLGGTSGFVDHGHHAAFHRETFLRLGGYDETAPFNEDAEFDARLREAGGRIYLDASLPIEYLPRSTFPSLSRQYRRHGWGRANTILKHGMMPRLRQIMPVLVFLTCITALAAWPLLGAAALFPVAAYLLAASTWGVVLAWKERSPSLLLSGPAAVVMHMSWAVGFLKRIATHQVSAVTNQLRSLGHRLGQKSL
jgi:succinoglycan biosynthesis protein ExoA